MKKNIMFLLVGLWILSSCGKQDDMYADVDYNQLGYIIADNQELSTFSTAIRLAGARELLLQPGRYTVLAPTNDAFIGAGYSVSSINQADPAWLSNMVNTHVLEGSYDLDKLQFNFNQRIMTRSGHPVFASRWLLDGDTVVTVNGGVLSTTGLSSNNGSIRVINKVISASLYSTVADHIADNDDATLFAYALQLTGVEKLLEGEKAYTVFVPNNMAMNNYGYFSLLDLDAADPDELREMVRYHLLEGFNFIYDYRLRTAYNDNIPNGYTEVDYFNSVNQTIESTQTYLGGKQGTFSATMLNGKQMKFTYGYGDTYPTDGLTSNIGLDRLTLTDGNGNRGIVIVNQRDLLADNGVFHIIDSVLEPND